MQKNEQSVSIYSVSRSFQFAFQGILYCFLTQCNMKIHIVLAVMALLFGFLLKFSIIEFAILFLTISMVFMAEMFNTAIETIVDLVSPEYHRLAKIAKDVAAGAVLCTAVTAAVIGAVLFIPKILR